MAFSEALLAVGVCAILFAAMGLLFIGGFGVSGGLPANPLAAWLKPHRLLPGFSEMVFLAFVGMSFVAQVAVAPAMLGQAWAQALERAITFAVPGQRAVARLLYSCDMDGGRVAAAAFAWLLAAIWLASACSRLKLEAGLIRLDQPGRQDVIGLTLRAFIFGLVAMIGIQFLYLGSAFPLLGCGAVADITGALLTGLAPLMLAYLIVAAMASLLASAPEA
jgi:hypothetical protein